MINESSGGARNRLTGVPSADAALEIIVLVIAAAVRVYYASSCYLNPDESMHYLAASWETWRDVYRASLQSAHPPLMYLMHHLVVPFASSELTLRLPSVLLGMASVVVLCAWVERVAGRAAALLCLLFACGSPAMISAASELRNSALLIFFVTTSLYSMERMTAAPSVAGVVVFSLQIAGALLSHYSAAWLATTLGFYVPWRLWRQRAGCDIWLAWVVGQVLLVALAGWTFIGHGDVTTARVGVMGQGVWYLKSNYFDPRHEGLLSFVVTRWLGVWHFLIRSSAMSALALTLFAAGVLRAALARGVRRDLALLLTLPFLFGTFAALLRLYPFGDSRHVSYLIPFAAAGFGLGGAWLLGDRRRLAAAIAVGVLPLWLIVAKPDNDPDTMDRKYMSAALQFLNEEVSNRVPVYTDFQSQRSLYFYQRQRGFELQRSRLGGNVFITRDGKHSYIDIQGIWGLNPRNVRRQIIPLAWRLGHLKQRELWLFTIGWGSSGKWDRGIGAAQVLVDKKFGDIRLTKLRVAEPAKPQPRA